MLYMEAYAWRQQRDFLVARVMGSDETNAVNVKGERFEFRIAADGVPTRTRKQGEVTARVGVEVSHGDAAVRTHLPNTVLLRNVHAAPRGAEGRRRNARSLENFRAIQMSDQVTRLIPSIRADWIQIGRASCRER